MKNRSKVKTQKSKVRGQALIEILVALAIVVIVATAFVTLAVSSLRNSAFSKNQAIATQLATEGIEAVITIRDQNTVGAIQNNSLNDQWSKLYQLGVVSPNCQGSTASDLTATCYDFYLVESTSPPGCLSTPPAPTPTPARQRCLQRQPAPYSDPSWQVTSNNRFFSRKIRITETGVAGEETKIKNVTVFVWWTDSQGLHRSILTRKVHRDKLE